VEDDDALKDTDPADRFGASVGVALRIQSEQLRTRRRQPIEENAGKIATKLLFPLIFCIFRRCWSCCGGRWCCRSCGR